MTRETMKRRRETADTVRKIETHKMATRKPCETALKQMGIKPLPVILKAVRGRIRTLWTT